MANLHISNVFNLKTVTGTIEELDGHMYCNPDASEQAHVTTSRKTLLPMPRIPKNNLARGSAVFLGLLCALLLAGILGLLFFHTEERAQWETGQQELLTSNNNLTNENNQLKNSYNNLTVEKDRLTTSYNGLTRERDQLKTSNNVLTTEKNQLQTSNNALTTERDQLTTSNNALTTERNQLKTSNTALTTERDQLKTSNNALTTERDQLRSLFIRGFRQFEGRFYYISTEIKTWHASRQDCQNRGAYLTVINNPSELQFLKGLNIRPWIGLVDISTNSYRDFRWVDGSSLTTGYWRGGEPNNYGNNERCVEFDSTQDDVLRSWNDVPCDLTMRYVCEDRFQL